MALGWDPSRDWDRHCAQEEDAAMAEVRWWRTNKAFVIQVACAIYAQGETNPFVMGESDVIEQAAKIVRVVTDKCADPYTGEE